LRVAPFLNAWCELATGVAPGWPGGRASLRGGGSNRPPRSGRSAGGLCPTGKVVPGGSARPTQSGLGRGSQTWGRGPDWVTRRFALGGRCEASGLGLADRRGARISIY